MNTQQQDQIEQIAKTHLGIETLASRHSDSLDFYDLGVIGIQKALEAAFKAGQASQQKQRPAKTAKNAPESARKYAEYSNRIDGLLDRLNQLRAAHRAKAAADERNWGFVGDLGAMETQLAYALERIGGPAVE